MTNIRFRASSTQFSVRTLLISLSLVAVCFGVYANPIMVRNRAIRELEAIGASITFDYQWTGDGARRSSARAPGQAWLKKVLGANYCAGVVEIQLFIDRDMSPEKFTDEHARGVATLTELKWLVLMDTNLTDEGLRWLKALPKLERLDVEGTNVTDEGVADFLKSRPNVRVFH